MPRLKLLLIFSFLPAWLIAQPPSRVCIDSLHTDADVQNFIRHLHSPDSTGLLRSQYNSHGQDSAWRIRFCSKSWETGDFDGNGTTDLLINGYNMTFADRRTYTVRDEGADGTYGTAALFDLFLHLRNTLNWKKISNAGEDFTPWINP